MASADPTPAPAAITAPAAPPAAPTPDPPDLVHGTFSESPPWLVDPDAMSWRRRVPVLRSMTRRSVPQLTTPPRVPPVGRMLRTVYELGSAVGLWWLVDRRRGPEASREGISRRIRVAAEHLGPTYIKLGQIISSGEGLFPAELVGQFKLLRDQVPAEDFPTVRRVVEEELGRPLEEVFSRFERKPLAAASIAQVHAATLRDGGIDVVVKVQRPAVGTLVRKDLRVMAWLAPFLIGRIPIAALANPPALVELFAETITEELDFRIEAANMLDIAASLAELGQNSFVIPRPHPSLVTRRVLVMERLDGYRFDDVAGMQAAGLDTHQIIRAGMIGFLEGCMISGIFHGDLHGGNLFVRPDGRTALLDFGITARMTPGERHAFLRLLMTASMNDVRGQLAALRDLGTLPPDTDLDAVIRDLNLDGPPVDPTTLTPDELVAEIQRMVKQLLAYGARLPKILMLFVKNLVFLDGAIASLAPGLDLFAEITHLSMYFATTHGERIAAEIGVAPDDYRPDLSGIKASFGVDPTTTHSLTYAELQERRALIRSRLRDRAS
ncbi:MAG: ABC1 kinase family protein [Acidimicrobiia bacterium]